MTASSSVAVAHTTIAADPAQKYPLVDVKQQTKELRTRLCKEVLAGMQDSSSDAHHYLPTYRNDLHLQQLDTTLNSAHNRQSYSDLRLSVGFDQLMKPIVAASQQLPGPQQAVA